MREKGGLQVCWQVVISLGQVLHCRRPKSWQGHYQEHWRHVLTSLPVR